MVDGVTYTQGWDHENRLVWVSTGGVTTTFIYDANGALVKKEDPLVGTTYYVGPHYEVLVPAVLSPPAPTNLEACHESGSPPNVCNCRDELHRPRHFARGELLCSLVQPNYT